MFNVLGRSVVEDGKLTLKYFITFFSQEYYRFHLRASSFVLHPAFSIRSTPYLESLLFGEDIQL